MGAPRSLCRSPRTAPATGAVLSFRPGLPARPNLSPTHICGPIRRPFGRSGRSLTAPRQRGRADQPIKSIARSGPAARPHPVTGVTSASTTRPAGFGGHSRAQSRSSTRRFLVSPLRCGTPDSAAASDLTLGPAGTPARSSRTSASRSAAARSFVAQMTSTRDAVIVRSTVDLGRNLGLRVVAEGSRTRPPGRSWTRSAATRSRATTSADPYAPTNSSTGSNSSGSNA